MLPPGHILIKTAEELQRQHEFEAALAASEAAKAAAAAARQAHHPPAVPLLQLPSSQQRPGSNGSYGSYFLNLSSNTGTSPASPFKWTEEDDQLKPGCNAFGRLGSRPGGIGLRAAALAAESPLAAEYFTAPSTSVEQRWKQGMAASTESVLKQAHMQAHEGPFGVLVLEPAVVIQPRMVKPPQPAMLDPTTGTAGSRPNSARRGTATSRPCSARRPSRISSCGLGDNGGPLAAFGSVLAASMAGGSTSTSSAGVAGSTAQHGQQGLSTAAAEGLGLGKCGAGSSIKGSGQSCQQQLAQSSSQAGLIGAASWGEKQHSACSSTCQSPSSAASSAAAPTLDAFHNSSSSSRQGLGASSSNSYCAAAAGVFDMGVVPPTAARRVAITGPRSGGINLLEAAGSAGGVAPSVPVLQLSRLGAQGAGVVGGGSGAVRPASAASTSRSRPGSAASTSRLAVSSRGDSGGIVQ